MFGRDLQVTAGVQEYIDCGDRRSTTAVSQDNYDLQAIFKMIHGVFQATEHLRAQSIAGHANYEKIVRSFAEDKFDWHPRVRATEDSGEGALLRHSCIGWQQADIARIDRYDPLGRAIMCQIIKECGEGAVTVLQPEQSCLTIQWLRSRR